MSTYMRRFLAAIIVSVIGMGTAFAADTGLTAAEANKFIDSLPALEAQAETFQDEFSDSFDFKAETGPSDYQQADYKNVYKKSVAALAVQSPSDYAKLKQTLMPFGLTPTRWAEVGDRVMSAYLALNMREESPNIGAAMQSIDMSQLNQLPPEIRAQIQASLAASQAMVTDMQSAPAADIEVVKTVRPKLEAYMDSHKDKSRE